MNKKLKETFAQAGINFNGSLGYGVVNGFETNVGYSSVSPIGIHFSCYTTDEQKRQVLQELRAATIKFSNFAFSQFGLSMTINDWTGGTLAKRLSSVLEKVCGILTSNGALGVGYCPVCGNLLDFEQSKKCNVDGMTISLDNDCVQNINNLINEENKDFNEAPNNYLRGFAGAFVGSLVGVVIAILFYVAGFISAISAFVAIFLGELLYRKFGGKPNAIMVVILSATVFVMMMLTVVCIYLVAAAIGADKVGMDTIDYFNQCMKDPEISRAFTMELVLTAVFTILGCGYEVYMLVKRIKRPKNI